MPSDHSYKACILVLEEYIQYFQEYPALLKSALHSAQSMNNTERMAIAQGSTRTLSAFQLQFDSTVTKEAALYPFEQTFRPLTQAMAQQLQADRPNP